MASSLPLLTSNLVTRSFPLPTIISAPRFRTTSVRATRFRTIRFCTIETGHQSYTTLPEDDFYNQSSPRILWPEISSMSFKMWVNTDIHEWCLELEIPNDPTGKKEGLCVDQYIYGLEKKYLKACEHKSKTHEQGINIPHKSSNDIKEMKDGILKTSIMANILANDIITSFREMGTKRTWAYYDMFTDRSILVDRFLPIIAMQSPISSFSIYKDETDDWLCIKMHMPVEEEMKLTAQGLHVTLDMRYLKRDDLKTYFVYDDTFFIEGKNKEYHYITGIKLPKGVHKRHNMIEREVKDGELYAIIPCCVNKEEIKFN